MAIIQMAKFMIVSHRGEAGELLESLQQAGICQILNADSAAVSKQMKDLAPAGEKPRDIEEILNRLNRSIEFLKPYSKQKGGLTAMLAPKAVIDKQTYEKAATDEAILKAAKKCNEIQAAIEKSKTEIDNLNSRLEELKPWEGLDVVIEELGQLKQARCWVGFVPSQRFEQLEQDLAEASAVIQTVGETGTRNACVIVALKEKEEEVGKLLRSAEFEQAKLSGITGTVTEAMNEISQNLKKSEEELSKRKSEAESLTEYLLKFEILYDHYSNLLNREQTEMSAPATQATIILEGWIRKKDFSRLEEIVGRFSASSLHKVEPTEDEDLPVEIENKGVIKPFEVITRLYGMPQRFEVDPTVFLAPFFALFFGLCLTDAGYGVVIFIISIFLIRKMQADKKLIWMLAICSVATVFAGALMGGWFGDAVQKFIPSLEPLRQKVMWFDPMEYPLRFFILSLILGYIQIMAGLLIAFLHDLKRKLFIAAVCDRLSWLVMLNSIVAFVLAKTGKLPVSLSPVFGYAALISAAVIFLFSQRQGSLSARLGMGFYNLFSAVFYVGDILSYLRLMALGLVTAGLAMAVNQIAKLAYDLLPVVGVVAAILILIFGHLFNMSINALGAFVHTLRLQYAEFFPKFFAGGGAPFRPLGKDYKYIYVKKHETESSEMGKAG